MLAQLDLFDLTELQLYRGRASENEHRDLDPALFVVDLFDRAGEIGKRTVVDTYRLARLEQRLRLRLVATVGDATQNRFCLFIGNRCRLISSTADKAHHTRSILDQVPSTLVHIHL